MADREIRYLFRKKETQGNILPSDGMIGEPFVNTHEGRVFFYGNLNGSYLPAIEQQNVFEVGGNVGYSNVSSGINLNNLFVVTGSTGKITTYQGINDLSDCFLSGTSEGFLIAHIPRVQPGVNIFTAGTKDYPTINLTAASINNLFVSGSSEFNTVKTVTISAGTMFSGFTNLDSIFQEKLWALGKSGSYSLKPINDSNITATGNYSLAEGYDTKASGNYSHAEGNFTTAASDCSHSEGNSTLALGPTSHAEGNSSTAIGNYGAHAEGYLSTSIGGASHSEGYSTTAIGNYSHSEGTNGYSYGKASHSEGSGTTAQGTSSHSEGIYTVANAAYSHAEGFFTSAEGISSHSEGNQTTVTGNYGSHSEGNSTIAVGNNGAHAEGYQTTSIGNFSHAEGGITISEGNSSHAEGYQTASIGAASHAEGAYSTSSGDYSHAEGYTTSAVGVYSHAEGGSTVASGDYSHASGYETIAFGSTSFSMGKQSISTNPSEFSISSGFLEGSRQILSQKTEIVLSVKTTASEAREAKIDNNGMHLDFLTRSNCSYTISASSVARKQDGSTASFFLSPLASIKNVGGSVSIVGKAPIYPIFRDSSFDGTEYIDSYVNKDDGYFYVTCSSNASENDSINWTVFLHITEVMEMSK